MQNWVCTKSAPACIFARRLFGSQPGGGSIGTSAAPSTNLIPPFTSGTSPFKGIARLRNSAGSVDTGGVISAVTTKSPLFNLAWRLLAIYDRTLPELPDLTVYLESLEARIVNRRLLRIQVLNPFLLRTAVPPIS